jgi:hypothetical protein
MVYYVCDRCGDIVTVTEAAIPEGDSWRCDSCGSTAAWEFTNADHARDHAAAIVLRKRQAIRRELA